MTPPNAAGVPCPCCDANTADAVLPLGWIRDGGSRAIDPRSVARIVKVLDDLEPVLLDPGTLTLIDGRQRFEAHTLAGRTSIAVRFAPNPVSAVERLLLGLAANRCHGRSLRSGEVSALIRSVIMLDSARTNGQIHRETGASKSTVQAQRERVARGASAAGVQIGPPRHLAADEAAAHEVQNGPHNAAGRTPPRLHPGSMYVWARAKLPAIRRALRLAIRDLRRRSRRF